ncbi:MAG TPA: hypothetical protein DCM54_02695 [Gammaproteobacteria bacterium]|nr:hypothetical protein [Gammaproteobacteria bacterium]
MIISCHIPIVVGDIVVGHIMVGHIVRRIDTVANRVTRQLVRVIIDVLYYIHKSYVFHQVKEPP